MTTKAALTLLSWMIWIWPFLCHNILAFSPLSATSSSSSSLPHITTRRYDFIIKTRTASRIFNNQADANAIAIANTNSNTKQSSDAVDCDLCIIGGGISGLSAAIEAASASKNKHHNSDRKIILLEAQTTPGGRVSSDYINGYTLDRGYAVFVEEYPQSKALIDYKALQLKAYEPGALIKIKGQEELARVADPLRQPSKLIPALTTPVGNFADKLKLVPLFYHVKTKSIEQLFEEDDEMDTLSCLKNKYKFSDKMIREFFEPFLVGIYFCPLDQQSSRMFHFVFKMFADGAGMLPTGGMQAVSDQLMERAIGLGVDIRLNQPVHKLVSASEEDNEDEDEKKFRFSIETVHGSSISSNAVICAMEGPNTEKLLSTMKGMEQLNLNDSDAADSQEQPQSQPQRSVGCFYYTYKGESPVHDKVLILNGEGMESGPALTVSFLDRINESYAPEGCGLCSVSIPESYMREYIDKGSGDGDGEDDGDEEGLDKLVRKQLSTWWPEYKDDITCNKTWNLEKTYYIKQAQPGQLTGPVPANVHGGRESSQLRGLDLPKGVYVCGDFMATATLNGAIESGINAASQWHHRV